MADATCPTCSPSDSRCGDQSSCDIRGDLLQNSCVCFFNRRPSDLSKGYRLFVEAANEYIVIVPEGVACDATCDSQAAENRCGEVADTPGQCREGGLTTSIAPTSTPEPQPGPDPTTTTGGITNIINSVTIPTTTLSSPVTSSALPDTSSNTLDPGPSPSTTSYSPSTESGSTLGPNNVTGTTSSTEDPDNRSILPIPPNSLQTTDIPTFLPEPSSWVPEPGSNSADGFSVLPVFTSGDSVRPFPCAASLVPGESDAEGDCSSRVDEALKNGELDLEDMLDALYAAVETVSSEENEDSRDPVTQDSPSEYAPGSYDDEEGFVDNSPTTNDSPLVVAPGDCLDCSHPSNGTSLLEMTTESGVARGFDAMALLYFIVYLILQALL